MNRLLLASLLGIILLILILRFYFYFSNLKQYENGTTITVITAISQQPKKSGLTQSFDVYPSGYRQLRVILPAYPELEYGRKLKLTGQVQVSEGAKGGMFYRLYMPKVQSVESTDSLDPLQFLMRVSSSVRSHVIAQYERILPKHYASLLLGIVFGVKGDFSESFLDTLKTAGVMHVIAASGMNITMVGGFFMFVLAAFLRRQIAILLSILIIVGYTFLAGFEPSLVRAAIMGSLAFGAQLFGRQYNGWYGLLLAGWIMLLVSPELITDIGFQLSFLATGGLIFINPVFMTISKLKGIPLWDDIVTTLSAQLATLPILLSFGTYSLWGIVVNALVLWTIPLLMVIGGIGAIVGLIFEPLAKLILYIGLPFLYYFEVIVSFFGRLSVPGEQVEIPVVFTIGYYLLLVAVLGSLKYRK